MDNRRNILGILGGLLVLIGSFLPWTSMLGVAVSGTASGAGTFIIVVGALIAVFAFLGKRWANILGVVLALIAGALTFKYINDVNTVGAVAEASVGIGLWIMLAGSILALLGCAMAAFRRGPAAPVVATAD